MVNPEEKLWKLIKSIDTISGAFLLRDSAQKKSLKERLLELTMYRLLIIFTFVMISNLFVTHFELIAIIFSCSFGCTVYGLCTTMQIMISNKDVLKDLLKWCENLYDVQKKYHKSVQNVVATKLITMKRKSIKSLQWLRIILYVDSFGSTLGFAVIGLFLPENIYPKFSPPLPFHLPFKNQKNWLSFICITILETFIMVDTATLVICVAVIGVTISIHILGYLDIIQELAKKMKKDVVQAKREEMSSKQSTTVTYIAVIESEKNILSFDEWIQVLNEMICEVNSKILSIGNVYTFPIFLNEFAGFGSLFICGLLFTVVRKQYLFAIGMTFACVLLFIVCYINEEILEKLENINEALYDLPWYNLTVRERKSLIILLHCDKIQKGFTAAHIHQMTLERFYIVLKAGYTNLLILKDLVQK